jgi:hypothetical protein
MLTVYLTAQVPDDHRVMITLPPEVPTGEVELVVTVNATRDKDKLPRTSLADWAEASAEHWGVQLDSARVEDFTGRSF